MCFYIVDVICHCHSKLFLNCRKCLFIIFYSTRRYINGFFKSVSLNFFIISILQLGHDIYIAKNGFSVYYSQGYISIYCFDKVSIRVFVEAVYNN